MCVCVCVCVWCVCVLPLLGLRNFRHVCEARPSSCLFSRPAVSPQGTTEIQPNGFSWNVILVDYIDIFLRILILLNSNRKNGHFTWRLTYLYVFVMEEQTVFSVRYVLKSKNRWRSEHLAICDKSTRNMVSHPIRDKCRRRGISCFVTEVKKKTPDSPNTMLLHTASFCLKCDIFWRQYIRFTFAGIPLTLFLLANGGLVTASLGGSLPAWRMCMRCTEFCFPAASWLPSALYIHHWHYGQIYERLMYSAWATLLS